MLRIIRLGNYNLTTYTTLKDEKLNIVITIGKNFMR